MTEVQASQPIIQATVTTDSETTTTTIDDDAYLLSIAEVDSLLPSTTNYFSGLFEGMNPNDLSYSNELSDIASLLAPQVTVSDDEAGGGESVTSESVVPADTPVTVASVRSATPPITMAVSGVAVVATPTPTGEMIPILPKLETTSKAAIVSPLVSQKRSFALQDDDQVHQVTTVPPLKKVKTSPPLPHITPDTPSLVLKPKSGTPFPTLAKSKNKQANPKSQGSDENKHPALPTLAPKPPSPTAATAKPLSSMVTKKKTETAASTAVNSAIAPPSKKAQQKVKAPKANKTNVAKPISVPTPAGSTSTVAIAAATAASSNNKPLSEEERAQQCRDRNRQHARNTRLRKKAYVEELKKRLVELVEERDAKLLEETKKAKITEQQREVRFQVMQDFLQLRGRNEGNPNRWGAILEEGFTLTLPKTTFQAMVVPPTDDAITAGVAAPNPLSVMRSSSSSSTTTSRQTLCGVTDIMTDSAYFASFLQTLSSKPTTTTATTPPHSHLHHFNNGDDTTIPTTFVYYCDRGTFLMDGCNAIMNWTAISSGAVQSGALRELELCGTMRARFCAQTNRLEKAEIHFDTGLVQSQLSFF